MADDIFSSESDPERTMPHMPVIPGEPAPARREDAATQQHMRAVPGNAVSIPAAAHPVPGAWGPPPPPPEHAARRRRKKRRGGEWAWVVVALALFGVTLVASVGLFALLRGNADAATDEASLDAAEATAIVILPTTVPNLDLLNGGAGGGGAGGGGGPGDEPDPDSLILEAWDGTERFTILVMGWDRRPSEPADGAYRTDTMMVVSLDPATGRIGILSIPRDLYVNIPGYASLQRVNSAYVLGELRQSGTGAALAMQTVQYNLGIQVHDYIIVDFNAFITFVDAIGGIDVHNPTTISDSQYPAMYGYGYDPFYLAAGDHHLDGLTALKFARTRHGSSDFRRAERQQQVIFAIRDRLLNLETLPQLILSAPSLWAQVAENVHTGLSLDQLLRLAWYARDIPLENIHTGVIDEQYISFYTTPDGASVVIPNRSRIGSLMVEVFGPDYNQ
ncbi:MAG: LCP family protein [Anaerolineae bacterium]|nr:LCP family protein [Anaerolineae bacterium]